jgi:FkbH-like protein
MRNILISSSSFLHETNESWDKISKNFNTEFSPHNKMFYSRKEHFAEINMVFLADILDHFDNSKKNLIDSKKKIKHLINLIKKNIDKKTNNIICFSHYFFDDYFLNLKKKNLLDEVISFFIENLYKLAKKYKNLFILDMDKIFASHGYTHCFSQRNYYLMSCRLSEDGLNIITNEVEKILNKIISPTKKVLILDCDNTIWGGVLGEDGIDKIQIGQDGIGKAFRDFQKVVKNLKNNGILIVLASKNEKKDVIKVVKEHKKMILKDEDITSYKINWEEKSKNIYELSEELMLGLDSFVFWDDNPIERNKVRSKLQMVEVIEPKQDVSEWPKQLNEYVGFLNFNLSKDDSKKTFQYKQRSKFLEKKKLFSDEAKYLKSIKVKISIEKLNTSNIDRAVQLTNKTNQFNFTTKRYTHKDIYEINKNGLVLLVKLKDIYGDHGIISLIIIKEQNNYLIVDTLLLSCRILGRYVENFLTDYLKKMAIRKKLKGTIFLFKKTEKNMPALNFINSIEGLKKLNLDQIKKLNISKKIYKDKSYSLYLINNKEKIINSDLYV